MKITDQELLSKIEDYYKRVRNGENQFDLAEELADDLENYQWTSFGLFSEQLGCTVDITINPNEFFEYYEWVGIADYILEGDSVEDALRKGIDWSNIEFHWSKFNLYEF